MWSCVASPKVEGMRRCEVMWQYCQIWSLLSRCMHYFRALANGQHVIKEECGMKC